MSTVSASQSSGIDSGSPDPRRWKALGVLGLIQFMLILDVTVVNVALPRIQHDLGFSQSGLAWVVNGYVLMAGGLLLLGGRLADILGRRAAVPARRRRVRDRVGDVRGRRRSRRCSSPRRFVQGAGEALAAPASLGLIALLFPDPRERMKALGLWGGIAGLGGTSGTVISGVLADSASWRWIFFINLPVAAFALVMVPRLVSESRMVREHRPARLRRRDHRHRRPHRRRRRSAAGRDPPLGLAAGAAPAASAGLALLALMVVDRGGLGLAAHPARVLPATAPGSSRTSRRLFFSSAFFSYFFLLTLFEQQVLHYSPLKGGLSYLPFGLTIGVGIGLGTALMPRIGVKPLLAAGSSSAPPGCC